MKQFARYPRLAAHLRRYALLLSVLVLLSGCTPEFTIIGLTAVPLLRVVTAPTAPAPTEPVTIIPFQGPLTNWRAEWSGLAWYGDHLILLPQWPSHWQNQIFTLHKSDIVDYLTGKHTDPLIPQPIPFEDGDLNAQLPGFQGFESIAFAGDQVFLTIETRPGLHMLSYLVKGVIAPDLSEVRIDATHLTPIEPQTGIDNLGEEAMFLAGDRVITIYEANSFFVNPEPVVHLFDDELSAKGTLPMVDFPYRITDATPLDAQNRFWVINYFFPGDVQLRQRLGLPRSQSNALAQDQPVERLVELEWSTAGVQQVDTPPINLQLLTNNLARNWEGIARLETPEVDGFLLATDTYPASLFGFVAKPK